MTLINAHCAYEASIIHNSISLTFNTATTSTLIPKKTTGKIISELSIMPNKYINNAHTI